MNKERIALQLALDQLASIYQSENLLKNYLKVLQNRACSKELKWQIFGQLRAIEERSKHLKVMLAFFERDHGVDSCEGIRGIVQGGLKLIEHYPEGEAKDIALIHALLMIHHYKLGIYKTILTYFARCEMKTEANFMLRCVREEKHTIEVLCGMDTTPTPVMKQHETGMIY